MWFLFHRLKDCSSSCFCCLPSGGWGYLRGLCRFPDGRDWWWVELGVALVGRAHSGVWFFKLAHQWLSGICKLVHGWCSVRNKGSWEPPGTILSLLRPGRHLAHSCVSGTYKGLEDEYWAWNMYTHCTLGKTHFPTNDRHLAQTSLSEKRNPVAYLAEQFMGTFRQSWIQVPNCQSFPTPLHLSLPLSIHISVVLLSVNRQGNWIMTAPCIVLMA